MKRIPIPPSAIYNALKRHGPLAIDEIGLCSRSHTIRLIQELRAAGQVYVSGWHSTAPGHYRMLLAAGCGIDAPMPKLSREEANRRQRAARLRRQAEQHAQRPAPPPPQLPTHHPRFGVWGI